MIALFFNVMYFMHSKTRRFILAFSVFIVFAIIYDLMRAYPNYLVNPVDISSLYHFEKYWFGVHSNNQLLTLNEFFAKYNGVFGDVICGFFYLNWISVPLGFGLFLYIKNKEQFIHFSLTFLLVNIIGFFIYYIHPAAPPWYVAQYGFTLHMNIPGGTAGLSRFDAFVHIPVFASIYVNNSNVFASLPSLHAAYPVVVFYFALRNTAFLTNCFFGLFMIGIWFSAVYTGHHYITDILLGTICAVTGILFFEKVLVKIPGLKRWLINYVCVIR